MENIDIDYKNYYKDLQSQMDEMKHKHNAIIMEYDKEIRFLKNIIRAILHF